MKILTFSYWVTFSNDTILNNIFYQIWHLLFNNTNASILNNIFYQIWHLLFNIFDSTVTLNTFRTFFFRNFTFSFERSILNMNKIIVNCSHLINANCKYGEWHDIVIGRVVYKHFQIHLNHAKRKLLEPGLVYHILYIKAKYNK